MGSYMLYDMSEGLISHEKIDLQNAVKQTPYQNGRRHIEKNIRGRPSNFF